MGKFPSLGVFSAALAIALVSMLSWLPCRAQSVSEYQVKAAYLYNFAKLTDWPSEAVPRANSPLTFCVFGGKEDFVSTLRSTLAGKMVDNHPLVINFLRSTAEIKLCQLVLFRGSQAETRAAMSGLEGAPILLVGEDPDFLAAGGMVNLVLKGGRVSYEVNPHALGRANISFSSDTTVVHAATTATSSQSGGERSLRFQAPPIYPEIAKKMDLKGTVQLRAVVRPDGTVKDVQIVGGHPLLANAAAQAVMKWRFEAASRETTEPVKISFGN